MKKILVPTDFSDHAASAAHYAVALGKQFNAHITLFHVYTLPPSVVYPPLYSAGHANQPVMHDEVLKLEQENELRLRAFRENLLKGKNDPCCNIVQRSGFVCDTITEFAEEKNFDLIVMGTRGSGSVSDFFIATNTWEVISSGKATVLAIPEKLSYKPLKHFAFASDFSDADFDSISTLTGIAKKFKAKVSVVHVKTDHDTLSEEQMQEWFDKKVRIANPYPDLEFKILKHENVQEALSQFIQQNQVDVIAMVNRKYNIFKRLFHKNLTKKFAYHSEVPLMVFAQ
jgi:nucleotide-binding universal stress UspA family protein